ncbi:hypothetical protein [Microbulbifer epialgicus]|uniref:Uncharacterized protein n=1 Tax=Microbulbifer epialgicus TaxID=393907 RepID=A0ABV4P4Y9_9GAMM
MNDSDLGQDNALASTASINQIGFGNTTDIEQDIGLASNALITQLGVLSVGDITCTRSALI